MRRTGSREFGVSLLDEGGEFFAFQQPLRQAREVTRFLAIALRAASSFSDRIFCTVGGWH